MSFPLRTVLLALLSTLGLLLPGFAWAAADTAVCAYPAPGFAGRRVCENARLQELDRKLGLLEDELSQGWHLDLSSSGAPELGDPEFWRSETLSRCADDACLERLYRQRLVRLSALPSFACTGTLSRNERLICGAPALGPLDRALNSAYQMALDASYSMLALQAAQARWLQTVAVPCHTAACLQSVYRQRILTLRRDEARSQARAEREAVHITDLSEQGHVRLPLSAAQQASIERQIAAAPDLDASDDLQSEHCAGGTSPQPAELLDLNHDGHPDPLYLTCGGAHNELAFFFLSVRGGYRLVLSDFMGVFGFTLQDARTHGLPMLRLVTHGSAADHRHALYAYDGARYRAVACFEEHGVREDFFTFSPAPLHQESCE